MDQNIKPPELLVNSSDSILPRAFVGNIELQIVGAAPVRRPVGQVSANNRCARDCKLAGNFAADAAGASSDQRDASIKRAHHAMAPVRASLPKGSKLRMSGSLSRQA